VKKKSRVKAKSKAGKKAKARKPVKAKAKAKTKVKGKAKAKKSSPKRQKTKSKAAPPKPGVIAPLNSVLLGFVEDYFAKIGVIALTLKAPVMVGQKIQVLGHTTNLQQTVDSMQIDHIPVTQARVGDSIGMKVIGRARGRDHVYLLK
jgi:hypothetical protein